MSTIATLMFGKREIRVNHKFTDKAESFTHTDIATGKLLVPISRNVKDVILEKALFDGESFEEKSVSMNVDGKRVPTNEKYISATTVKTVRIDGEDVEVSFTLEFRDGGDGRFLPKFSGRRISNGQRGKAKLVANDNADDYV